MRLYSISRVFGQRVFGEINMCELLILKLDLCSNVSDFTSIGQRWIHFLFNEKESSLEPRNSKNQNTFLSWFLVRKTSWRTPAGFSKFPTEISDRDFRPYRIQPKTALIFLTNSDQDEFDRRSELALYVLSPDQRLSQYSWLELKMMRSGSRARVKLQATE